MNPAIRRFIDSANSFITAIKKNRQVRPNEGIVKVNLGCGLSVASGWINIDASPNALFSKAPGFILSALYRASGAKQYFSEAQYMRILRDHTFLHHNLEYGIPYPDASVDYIYSSHWLEHLFRDDADRVLREAYRVLKPGGCIRICVPDLEYAVAQYLRGDKQSAMSYFFTESKAGILGRHQYMYDYDLLKSLLSEVGFKDIERCAYQEGRTPDLDKLDNRPEETLYVLARR